MVRSILKYGLAFYVGVLLTMHAPFASGTYAVLELISRLP